MSDSTRRIGRYRLIRVLGQGGMGTVFEAVDERLDRAVALKFIRDVEANDEGWQVLLREARAAARLNHPDVISVYDAERHEDGFFISTEFIPGGSVADHLSQTGAIAWPTALAMGRSVCRALVAAHASGMLHRDIKPANLLMVDEQTVKLADFGLARIRDGSGGKSTTANRILGTAHYMSPEACRAEPLDERSDIYSLGATLFHLLAGRPMYDESSAMQVMFAQCQKAPPELSRLVPSIPAEVESILNRALAKEPGQRFQSATELLVVIEDAIVKELGPQALVEQRSADATIVGTRGRGAPSTLATDPESTKLPVVANTDRIAALKTTTEMPLNSSARYYLLVGLLAAIVLVALMLYVGRGWLNESGDALSDGSGAGPTRAPTMSTAAQPNTTDDDSETETNEEVVNTDNVREPDINRTPVDGIDWQVGGRCEGLDFSNDDRFLAAARYSEPGGILLRDRRGEHSRRVVWPNVLFSTLAFSHDSKWLAAGGRHGTGLHLLELSTGNRAVHTFQRRLGGFQLRGIRFFADDNRLLLAVEHYQRERRDFLQIWSRNEDKLTPLLAERLNARLIDIAISFDDRLIAATTASGQIFVYNLESQRILHETTTSSTFPLVRFQPNTYRLAVATEGRVAFHDGLTWTPEATTLPYLRSPTGLQFTSNGEYLALLTDTEIALWDAKTLEIAKRLQADEGSLFGLAISANQQLIAAGSNSSNSVRLWRLDDLEPTK